MNLRDVWSVSVMLVVPTTTTVICQLASVNVDQTSLDVNATNHDLATLSPRSTGNDMRQNLQRDLE